MVSGMKCKYCGKEMRKVKEPRIDVGVWRSCYRCEHCGVEARAEDWGRVRLAVEWNRPAEGRLQ